MIKIICVGKIKEKYLKELIEDYQKRISKYHKIEIIEVNDENDLSKEKEHILKHIKEKEFIITCEIEGKNINSNELANLIDNTFIHHSTITFIIGSSDGLHNEVKEKRNMSLSISQLTFPHGLFRGILLETIYRSMKIINNEKYHK